MGRPLRADVGGFVYHALNRANARLPFCHADSDYLALERVLAEALKHVPGMRLLAYCLMPNHWHLVLWPTRDGEMAKFMHWLTLTHTQRWHAHRHNIGSGHLYQGRYKSFPVEEDDHFYTMCRYLDDEEKVSGPFLARRSPVAALVWPAPMRKRSGGFRPATAARPATKRVLTPFSTPPDKSWTAPLRANMLSFGGN